MKSEELFVKVQNIGKLYPSNVEVSEGFLQPNPDRLHVNTELLTSLRSVLLEDVTLEDGRYSAHRVPGEYTACRPWGYMSEMIWLKRLLTNRDRHWRKTGAMSMR